MENNIYNPEYVKGLFNRMSSSYERVNFITSFGFSIRWRRQFLNSFRQTNHKSEIIDLLTGMLKYAKHKSKKKFNGEIIVLQQDILNNELPSNYYDFVTCAFGLKTFNAEQLEILAIETNRILKVGGQFSFIEVSKPDNKMLKALYSFYLSKVIPVLGRLLLGNPEEYKMLWQYTNKFENAKMAATIFKNTGLKTKFSSYFYGCATGFYGTKTEE